MKILFSIILFHLNINPIFCQNWFPLEVGNISLARDTYSYFGTPVTDFYFISVEKDTIVNGKKFFWVKNYSDRVGGTYENFWLRYSTDDQKIYMWANDTSGVFMDFNLTHGGQFDFYNPETGITTTRTVFESTGNFFGGLRQIKGFNSSWYHISIWVDSIGVKPRVGSLIQVLQMSNPDTIYFEYGYGPDFHLFEPLLFSNTLNFNFDFFVDHKYSNPYYPAYKDFLDSVYLDGFYVSLTDTIQTNRLYASSYPLRRINIQLDSNLIENGYLFYYKITAKDKGLIPKYGFKPDSGLYNIAISITSVENNHELILTNELFQNYPNPFNPSTKISWQSPVGSHQTLKVYDVLGREVATLVDEYRDAGSYEVEFDGSQLASGVYYYRLKVGDLPDGKAGFVETRKMILMK